MAKLTMDQAANQLGKLARQLETTQKENAAIQAKLDQAVGQLIDLGKRLAENEEQMRQIRSKINDILTITLPANWRILAEADNVVVPDEDEE